MKLIKLRSYRLNGIENTNGIAINTSDLLDFLNKDLGDGIGYEEKMTALNNCLNLREPTAIYERIKFLPVEFLSTHCRVEYMLTLTSEY